MTIAQILDRSHIQLIHYFNAQTTDQLRTILKQLYVERYVKYNIALDEPYKLVSNLIVQRTTDLATKARMQQYGVSRY